MLLEYLKQRQSELQQMLQNQEQLCRKLESELTSAKQNLLGMMGGIQEINTALEKAQEGDKHDGA